MEWNEETTLQLIDTYKEKELLWNPRHCNYYNKIMKNDAWSDISKQMERTQNECKRKMFSVLSALRREKSKIKKSQGTGKGADEIYNTTWFAFQSLQFILDKDVPRNTLNTVTTENSEDIKDNVDKQDNVSHPVSDEENINTLQSIENKPALRKRKRFEHDVGLDTAFKLLTKCASTASNDDCEDFGNLVAKRLRLYESRIRSAIQIEFMSIFLKADTGFYNHSYIQDPSSQQNAPYVLSSVNPYHSNYPPLNIAIPSASSYSTSDTVTQNVSCVTPQSVESSSTTEILSEGDISLQCL